jgi:hypothetical protein
MVRYQFSLVTCVLLLIVLQVGQMGVKLETRFGFAEFVRVQWRAAVNLLTVLVHSAARCYHDSAGPLAPYVK